MVEQQLYFNRQPFSDLCAALQQYPGTEFQSQTRSPVPLIAMLKNDTQILQALLTKTGMNTDCTFHLEYTVGPPKGRGIASHTDLMVRSQTDTLAVEAKWTEPRYDTVAEWIGKGKILQNRIQVLTGWLDLIQPHAAQKLHPDDFSGAVYQMLHRAASACSESTRPRLAYLHFKPDRTIKGANSEQYKTDLAHLHTLLGNPSGFKFYFIEVEIRPTAAFEQIKDLPKASPETACTVLEAFEHERLFEFKDFGLHVINGKDVTVR